MEIWKAKSTNNATKLWIDTFKQYLEQEELPKLDQIPDSDLPNLLESFYVLVRMKKSEKYKSTTLKSMRAGLNRYFKDHREIDITQDKRFMRTNELFLGLLKENKKEGRGQVIHKQTISDSDKEKLFKYFENSIKSGKPDPKILQQICIFNIVYYMGWHGRENLRNMQKDTFEVREGLCRSILPSPCHSKFWFVSENF